MIRKSSSFLLATVSVAAVSLAGPAFAQPRHFDIPAQPANTGIQEFGRQAGVQIMAPSEALANLSTRKVAGTLDVRAGLDQLLKDTGLQALSSDGKRFVVRKATEQAAAPRVTNREATLSPVVMQMSSAPAAALTAEPQAALDVGEVVVTASRIQSAGFTAPTPTTVLGATDLLRRAPVTIQESLNEVPSFRPSTTTQNTSSTALGTNASAGAALVDLRGLGSARTLLLINGRRTGGSQASNQFPTIMTQRVDVVTGGASAAYGSDAVAGVINIMLDNKFEGLRGDFQYGQSKYGDNENWKGSLEFGTSFMDGRGHFVVGGEYNDSQGATTAEKGRRWIAANRQLSISNPCPRNVPVSAACPTGGNGLSPFLQEDNVNFATAAIGSVITAGPLKGITFDPGGVPRQFQYGLVLGQVMLGGERSDPSVFNLNGELRRYAIFSHLDFKLTDKLNSWFEYSNAKNIGRALSSHPRDQGNITIRAENPFIPASLRAQMAALNQTTITLGRVNNSGDGQPVSTNTNDVFRFAGGFEGELGGGWTWDAYAQHGTLHTLVKSVGNRNQAAWQQALDAVPGPNGVAVCRNPANGCVPFNIFGDGSASDAAKAFVFGTQTNDTDRSQTAAAFNLRGEPLSTWAGPISLAAGAEYRKEKYSSTSDPLALRRGWDVGNVPALTGQFSVYEGYAEVAVPLAKDMTFAKSFDFNGAIRRTHYSTSGGYWVTTWKAGATWEPTSDLLLRGTLSRDIRAPSITELYNPGTTTNNPVINFQGPFANQNVIAALTTSGNPNLRPERANTFTAGFTYRPNWTRLRFSADYYRINVKDQIGALGPAAVVDRCRIGDQSFCQFIGFNTVGTITTVLNQTVNTNSFITRGIDLEASYSQPLDQVWSALKGTLTARALATHYIEYALVDDVLGKIDRTHSSSAAGQGNTWVPDWLATYTVSYNLDRFTSAVQFRYISSGVADILSITGTATERSNNKISSQTVTNLSASYDILRGDRKLQIFGAVNNVFNRGVPYSIFPLSNLAVYYDAIGMQWRAGVRFTY